MSQDQAMPGGPAGRQAYQESDDDTEVPAGPMSFSERLSLLREWPRQFRGWLRRLSPVAVILLSASFASLFALSWSILSRSTPIPILVSAGVMTGIVYALDTIAAAISTFRAGQDGRIGRALLLALFGGAASLISALSFAGSLVLVLLLSP